MRRSPNHSPELVTVVPLCTMYDMQLLLYGVKGQIRRRRPLGKSQWSRREQLHRKIKPNIFNCARNKKKSKMVPEFGVEGQVQSKDGKVARCMLQLRNFEVP